MTEVREIYKCKKCGNIVEVLHNGIGALVCCGEPMKLMDEKTEDASTEKHVPYIEKTENGVIVKVGQNQDHPMEEKHYIELIQLIKGNDVVAGKRLNPADEPVAEFCNINAEGLKARIFCNIHGVWVS